MVAVCFLLNVSFTIMDMCSGAEFPNVSGLEGGRAGAFTCVWKCANLAASAHMLPTWYSWQHSHLHDACGNAIVSEGCVRAHEHTLTSHSCVLVSKRPRSSSTPWPTAWRRLLSCSQFKACCWKIHIDFCAIQHAFST